MEDPAPIDLATWPRRTHFAHYRTTVPCTYALTVELDATEFVSAVRSAQRRTYISQIWAIAEVVNRHDEFRMTLTESGDPAVWSHTHPAFTVFNRARETFASVWAPFDRDFDAFHAQADEVIARFADAAELFPQGPPPPNSFDVSSLPWSHFTGFTLNVNGWDHLAPIFTLGKYAQREGRILLPLAVQVHHAAADGFHTTRLVNEIQQLLSEPGWLTG